MFTMPSHSDHIHNHALTLEQLRQQAPAIFAKRAAPRTRPTYRFIRTAEVVKSLMTAGFTPTHVRQSRSRAPDGASFARHLIRFRHARESVTLRDAVPEVVLINAHDGTATYQLRLGLFRPVCSNGLLTRMGDFGLIRITHRANLLDDVVSGALALTGQFASLGAVIERMAQRRLEVAERLTFAEQALRLRFGTEPAGFSAERVLEPRRAADDSDSLWHVFNVAQEVLLRGGVTYTSARGRLVRSRAIRAIREDVRLNTGLWDLAQRMLRGEASLAQPAPA